MSDHQLLNPFLMLPRTGALFFAGAAFFIAFIDPQVRDTIRNPRTKLTQWTNMYQISTPIMVSLILGTTGAAIKAYFDTKENLWLIGGLTMSSIIAYTFIFMMKLNN